MSERIRITPEGIRKFAKEYSDESDKLQKVIERMELLLEELQIEWEGESSIAFADRFEGLKPSVNETRILIDDISKQLISIADNIEALDDELTIRMNV